jgi:hypothetical protein
MTRRTGGSGGRIRRCPRRMRRSGSGETSENTGARRYELGRGRNSFVLGLRRGGVRAVRFQRRPVRDGLELADGQCLAQGLALDAVSHGDAVAVGVGQGGAGG